MVYKSSYSPPVDNGLDPWSDEIKKKQVQLTNVLIDNCINGVKVTVFTLRMVDNEFDLWSNEIKNYKTDITK